MKKLQPTPEQTFLVLSMLFGETDDERQPPLKKLTIKAPARRVLEDARVVRVEARKGGKRLVLDDDAWDFAATHLSGPLPKTPRAARVLSLVLAKVQRSLQTHEHALAEFITGESSDAPRPPREGVALPTATDEGRIREACLALAEGQIKRRVRLSELRRKLTASRESLDRALLALQEQGRLVLYRMDNPAEITAEDERAALSIAGQPRHLVYLEA